MITADQLKVGAVYAEAVKGFPGQIRLLRYLGKEHDTYAFLCFDTLEKTSSHYIGEHWLCLEREVSLEEQFALCQRRREKQTVHFHLEET